MIKLSNLAMQAVQCWKSQVGGLFDPHRGWGSWEMPGVVCKHMAHDDIWWSSREKIFCRSYQRWNFVSVEAGSEGGKGSSSGGCVFMSSAGWLSRLPPDNDLILSRCWELGQCSSGSSSTSVGWFYLPVDWIKVQRVCRHGFNSTAFQQ